MNPATEILNERRAVYGDRVENMVRIAQVWSGILGTTVRPDQVPLLMIGLKTVRASVTPDYSDNIDDVEGYSLMFREVLGDDMVDAKSVKEYEAKRLKRLHAQAAEVTESEGLRHAA